VTQSQLVRFVVAFFCVTFLACGDDDKPTSNNPPAETGPVTLIAADRSGNIMSVNPSTGEDVEILVTLPPVNRGGGIGVVSGMLYVEETGQLWLGMGGNSICAGCVMTVDVSTGVVTQLRDNSSAMNGVPDFAMRDDGTIFVSEGDGSSFYEADPVTGEFTLLGVNVGGSGGSAMTFASDGSLYLTGNDDLYEVDPDAPSSTELGVMTLVGFPAISGYTIGSMTTRPSDGAMFGILKDDGGTGGAGPTYLCRIDPSTLEVTNVGVNARKLDGLAFVPENLIE